MEDHQKSALRHSHVTLVQNLEPRGPVLDTLLEDGVLTENDCERITHAPTQKERCQLLLHLIPTRGPGAYGSFQKALKKGEYGFLADKLNDVGGLSEQTHRKFEALDGHRNEPNDTQDYDACKDEVKSIIEACQDPELGKVIEECGSMILDNVEPTDVIDQLFQDGVINTDEVDDIRSKSTRRERCRNLLQIVSKTPIRNTQTSLCVSNRSCGNYFVKSLKLALTKKYKYIAQRIPDGMAEDRCTEIEESTEAKVVDRPILDNEYCDFHEENTHTEIFIHTDLVNKVNENDESDSETDLKVINDTPCSLTHAKTVVEMGTDVPDGVRLTQTHETTLHKKQTSPHKRKTNKSLNTTTNKAKERQDGNTQSERNTSTHLVRHVEMAVMPSSQSHKRHRLTVAFNYLSTMINQGEFEKYDALSTNLQYRCHQNHDLMCIIGYLNASRDLFKTDFDSAKRNINATMQIVPKTSNPRYFILELFTAKTRMYITQKKLEKLQKTLDEAMMILETDPGGCTGRAAGWLYINDARNKTAQMSCLNLSKPNALKLYEQLFNRAKTSFQRAMNNFEMDGGKDGPFGFGYALCRLVILLLRCGDNGMTMSVDAVTPSKEEVDSAEQYIKYLEDSDIAIPKIMDMHLRIAKCDYQFRRGNLVRGLQHAQEAFDLATELNMLEFTEHAHNRLKLLRGMAPMRSDKNDMTEEEIQRILFGESTDSNEISQSE